MTDEERSPSGGARSQESEPRNSAAFRRATHGVGAFLLPLVPAALTVALVGLIFESGLGQMVPVWDDEIFNWHEVSTFAAHGFAGGHYSIDELVSTATFTSFGTHGPGFAAVYGSAARLVGWLPSSAPFFNLFAIAMGLASILLLTRPSPARVAGLALLTATFWPLLIYAPSSMQESLHHAFALVFGGFFYRLITDREPNVFVQVATPVLIAVAAFVRPTWALLLIPYLVLAMRLRKPSDVLTLAGAGTAVAALSMAASLPLVAQYPAGFLFEVSQLAKQSLPAAVQMFAEHAGQNIITLLDPIPAPPGSFLESGQRIGVMALIAYSLFRLLRRIGQRGIEFCLSDGEARIHFFHLVNLLSITSFLVLFYEIGPYWRDFRVLAPHLLLSLVVCVLSFVPRILAVYVMAALLLGPAFLEQFDSFHRDRIRYGPDDFGAFRRSTEGALAFDAEGGAWTNSLLINATRPHLLGLPPGIGINFVLDSFPEPIRSKYVILTLRDFRRLRERLQLRPLAMTPIGILSLNMNHVSEPPPRSR